jgi:hypothetical protein
MGHLGRGCGAVAGAAIFAMGATIKVALAQAARILSSQELISRLIANTGGVAATAGLFDTMSRCGRVQAQLGSSAADPDIATLLRGSTRVVGPLPRRSLGCDRRLDHLVGITGRGRSKGDGGPPPVVEGAVRRASRVQGGDRRAVFVERSLIGHRALDMRAPQSHQTHEPLMGADRCGRRTTGRARTVVGQHSTRSSRSAACPHPTVRTRGPDRGRDCGTGRRADRVPMTLGSTTHRTVTDAGAASPAAPPARLKQLRDANRDTPPAFVDRS